MILYREQCFYNVWNLTLAESKPAKGTGICLKTRKNRSSLRAKSRSRKQQLILYREQCFYNVWNLTLAESKPAKGTGICLKTRKNRSSLRAKSRRR